MTQIQVPALPARAASATRAAAIAVCIVIAALTLSLRFLATVSYSNDEYISMAGAQEMLVGDWPTRDFLDNGAPLMFTASAAAQLLYGHNLFAETMLTAGAFALAAALTVVAVTRLSGWLSLGVAAALLEIAFFPRGYAYPKVLLYAAAPLVIWWYARRPASWARLLALAAFVQIAFLFRHDHGFYLGVTAATAVALSFDHPAPMAQRLRRCMLFALLLLIAAVPYLAYVQVNGGVIPYFVRGLAVSTGEAAGNHLTVPPFGPGVTVERNAEAFLFYLFCALPALVAAAWLATARTGSAWKEFARVAPLVVMAVLVDRAFLRDELSTRLVDAFVPAALLFAWLCGRITCIGSRRLRSSSVAVAVAAACFVSAAVVQVGRTGEQLNRAGLFGGLRRLPERFAERSSQLHDRFNEHQMPSRAALALVPFFHYVDRCTTPDQRLLLPGQISEVAVYAQRPIAGGRLTMLAHYNDAPEDRRVIQARLRHQIVPFALVTPNDKDAAWAAYPEVAAAIENNYRPLASYKTDGESTPDVYVFVSRTLKPHGVDEATGWPCFR